MRLSLRLPARFLRGHASRLALTVVALGCGVSLVCAVDLVNAAVYRAFADGIDSMAGRAALQVAPGADGLLPEAVAETVAGVAGVERAIPVVSATAFVADGSGALLTVHGVDVTDDAALRAYEPRPGGGLELDDPLVFVAQQDSIILTRTFAARRGLRLDDRLRLDTPSGRRAFVVRGLIEPEGIGRVYGGALAVMDLVAAEAAFTRPGFVNRIDVIVRREADVAAVAAALRQRLPAGLAVEAPAQRKADLHRVMRSTQVLLQGVGLVSLVAAFLIAFNRLGTVFEQRAWQLGVLRAVGVRARAVWWTLLQESVVLGLLGVALGIPLGFALAALLLPLIATTTALAAQLTPTEATLGFRATSVATAAALGLGAAVASAAQPAWRAASPDLAAALRLRGAIRPPPSIARALAAGGLLLAAALGCAVAQTRSVSPAWGLTASVLLVLATAAAARPMPPLLARLMAASRRRGARPTAWLGSALTAGSHRRMALTIAMIGVGLGIVLWMLVIGRSFERSVVDTLSASMRADLTVSSAHIASGFVEAPIHDGLVGELDALPGVAAAAGLRTIELAHGGGPISINAFDPVYFANPRFGAWPLVGAARDGVWQAVGAGRAVVASTNFLQTFGLAEGAVISLETPSGPLRLPIAGTTVDYASPRGTLEMSRAVYLRHWRDPRVSRVYVELAPGTPPADAADAIRAALGGRHPLRILFAGEIVQYFADQVRRAFVGAHVLAGTVFLVVLLGLADTLAAGVMERTRELGTLRAIGVRRRAVGRLVVVESLWLGLAGLALAALCGYAMGALWVHATFPRLLGWLFDLHFPWRETAAVVAVTTLISLLAAALPARRASRQNPAAALRYE